MSIFRGRQDELTTSGYVFRTVRLTVVALVVFIIGVPLCSMIVIDVNDYEARFPGEISNFEARCIAVDWVRSQTGWRIIDSSVSSRDEEAIYVIVREVPYTPDGSRVIIISPTGDVKGTPVTARTPKVRFDEHNRLHPTNP